MTLFGTILIALLMPQSTEGTPASVSSPISEIGLPEEMSASQPEAVSESTWQDTEIEVLMQKARNSLQEDRYPEALDLYIAASDRRPLDERLQYNLGVAAYRAGDMETATRAFERASNGSDPDITQSALFNRGNVSYRQALKSVENAQTTQSREMATQGRMDPETLDDPIEALEQALTHYRDAIISSPNNRDARRNAELTHRLIKALEQKQEEQEQQQEQDQQEQDQQEQDQQEQDSKESEDKSDEESANSANSTNKETAPVRMTREQAEALLQMIRDKEKERREVLAAREAREAARKKTPVEKDW
jgi:tetratricopeptide (TPR) repeat protein